MASIIMGYSLANVALVLGVIFGLGYYLYLRMLPKPFPGIPYNENAAKRILGDLPNVRALAAQGISRKLFFARTAAQHNSPIVQLFLSPFGKPVVAIADYREVRDLTIRRSKNLCRGYINTAVWADLAPDHFIAMESHDERFKATKDLSKDLMTPSFLHKVSGPASYQEAVKFLALWDEKAKIADGSPFDAQEDLGVLTFEVIKAAALGHLTHANKGALHQIRVDMSQPNQLSAHVAKDKDTIYPFPLIQKEDLHIALHDFALAIRYAYMTPLPRVYNFFNNRRKHMREAFHNRRTIIGEFIDQSIQKLAEQGDNFEPASAVDYIVAREDAAAKKAGRPPNFQSGRMIEAMFGYLAGGQDSTHSTLSFMVKHLGEEQEIQHRLRQLLREAYPEALAKGEQPSLPDIVQTEIPFLDGFVQEVLRLSNPAITVAKQLSEDTEILGYMLPKGTSLAIVSMGPTFTEPGPDVDESLRSDGAQKAASHGVGDWKHSEYPPQQFAPERWIRPDEKGEATFDSQAGPFFTFSNGPRVCWGRRLAYLELKLITTLFLWNFHFEKLPPQLHDWVQVDDLFDKPKNCYVKLRRLNKSTTA